MLSLRANAIQMPFPWPGTTCWFAPWRPPSQREVVANCGLDPRTRPDGNGEELSRGRVVAAACRLAFLRFPCSFRCARPVVVVVVVVVAAASMQASKLRVQPSSTIHSLSARGIVVVVVVAERVHRFRGSSLGSEAADKSGPRGAHAAARVEFECERICRGNRLTRAPSAARKWAYNLSPSSRPAINRAALSANELSPLPPPHPPTLPLIRSRREERAARWKSTARLASLPANRSSSIPGPGYFQRFPIILHSAC